MPDNNLRDVVDKLFLYIDARVEAALSHKMPSKHAEDHAWADQLKEEIRKLL